MESLKIKFSGDDNKTIIVKLPENWLQFIVKIPACFEGEKEENLRKYWIDLDGDKIELFDVESYEIFLKQNRDRRVVYLEKRYTKGEQVTENGNLPNTNNGDATKTNENEAEIPTTSALSNIEHVSVACDSCKINPIVGYRYKCLRCPNYDLCLKCEVNRVHADHLMLRIPDSNDNHVRYMKGSVFPEMRKMLSKHEYKTESSFRHRGRRHAQILKDFYYMMNDLAESATEESTMFELDASKAVPSSAPGLANVKYWKVACDSCNMSPIFGFRYKCLKCYDYAICFKCEAKGVHKDHLMLRMPDANYHNLNFFLIPKIRKMINESEERSISLDCFNRNFRTHALNEICNRRRNGSRGGSCRFGGQWETTTAPKQRADINKNSNEQQPNSDDAPTQPAVPNFMDPVMYQVIGQDFVKIKTDFSNIFGEILKMSASVFNSINFENTTTENRDEPNANAPSTESKEENKPTEETTTNIPEKEFEKTTPSNSHIVNKENATDLVIDDNLIDIEPRPSTSYESANVATAPQRENEKSPTPDDWTVIDNVKEKDSKENSRKNSIPAGDLAIGFEKLNKDLEDLQNKQEKETKAEVNIAVPVFHEKPHVNEAILAMMAMGFSNEGNWLTQLLDTVDGDISKALDLMKPTE